MKQTLAVVIIAAVCLSACGGGADHGLFSGDEDSVEVDVPEAFVGDTLHLFEDEEEPPAAVDQLFNDFFFQFACDVRFQKQRIRFPLKCSDGGDLYSLSSKEWTEANRFEGQEFLSVICVHEDDVELQNDTSISKVAVDWVHLQDSLVETYSFRRFNGLWILMEVAKEQISQHANSDFLSFYSQFMTDSVYQHNALRKPLRLILTPMSEDDETQIEEIAPEQWDNLRADLPFNTAQLVSVDYGQLQEGADRTTLSIEGLSNGFMMKLRFIKEDEQWKLFEIEY